MQLLSRRYLRTSRCFALPKAKQSGKAAQRDVRRERKLCWLEPCSVSEVRHGFLKLIKFWCFINSDINNSGPVALFKGTHGVGVYGERGKSRGSSLLSQNIDGTKGFKLFRSRVT